MKSSNNKKLHKDLWGLICQDYFEKGQADFIIRRDDGYIDHCKPDVKINI
ncbi:MAG: hypothetical protein ACOCUI_01385 [bacterium]